MLRPVPPPPSATPVFPTLVFPSATPVSPPWPPLLLLLPLPLLPKLFRTPSVQAARLSLSFLSSIV